MTAFRILLCCLLISAKDDLDDAQTAVDTARHNLFTAYRTYRWAVDRGLLNT